MNTERRSITRPDTERRTITRPDGRKIEFLVAGPPDGLPLVLHEGTPAASIAGVAPYAAKGLDWLAGMGPENVAEFGAATRGEAALTAFLDHEAVMLSTLTGESVAKSLGGLVIEADRAVLTGEFADYVAAGLRASMNSGIAGWRDDDLAFINDWGFSLGWESPGGEAPARAPAPVAVWQGDQDRMVPFAHGQWLAANIRGARAHLMPGDGHLSMTVSAFDRILDDLLDLAGLTP